MTELAFFVLVAFAVVALVWFVVRLSKATGKKRPAKRGQPNRIAELRQNLRVKVFYDEAKIDRLVEFERDDRARKGQKTADIETLLVAAIERWERDNSRAASLY
jgi:hypothetical protein